MSSTSTMPTNYDEVYMQETMLFSCGLKDLRTIRKQLYRAAEYFESSYANEDCPELLDISQCDVVDVLKEYAIKALVNTVDHFGYVTNKVNNLLDDQADKASETELYLSSIEQRLRSYHNFIDRIGRSQNSMFLDTRNYHKRYILPVGETMQGAFCIKSKHQGCTLDDESEWHQYKKAIQANVQETPHQTTFGGSRSPLRGPQLSHRQNRVTFSSHLHNRNANTHPPLAAPMFTQQQNRVTFSNDLSNLERREPSPYWYTPPHSCSYPKGIHAADLNTSQPIAQSRSKQTTPIRSRPTTSSWSKPTTPSRPTITMTPNRDLIRQQYTCEVQNLDSISVPVNEDREHHQSKTKARIKAFINRLQVQGKDR